MLDPTRQSAGLPPPDSANLNPDSVGGHTDQTAKHYVEGDATHIASVTAPNGTPNLSAALIESGHTDVASRHLVADRPVGEVEPVVAAENTSQTGSVDAGATMQEFLRETGVQQCIDSGKAFDRADHTAKASALVANALLYRYLTDLYRVNADRLVASPHFKTLCKENHLPCTEATRGNPYITVIRLSSPGIDRKRASLLATALRFAKLREVRADELEAFMRANGGVAGCAKRMRDLDKEASEASDDSGSGQSNSQPAPHDVLVVLGAHPLARGRHVVEIDIGEDGARWISSTPAGGEVIG